MFDLGWPEMLVIAIVLIVVVGPKDLPRMLRNFGRTTAKLRSMAGDFRKQFDEAMREAELDEVRQTIDSARKLNPTGEIKKALSPMEKAAADVKSGLDQMMKPTAGKPAEAQTAAKAVPPAKTAATAMPGEKAARPARVETTKTAAKAKPAASAKPSAAKGSAKTKSASAAKTKKKSSGAGT
jgi:sec-independent protein translocase protein TatB